MNCQHCQSKLNLIPAGVSKKTGKQYSEFWSCPQKCKYPMPFKPSPDEQKQLATASNLEKAVVDGFSQINARLDELAKYLKVNLGDE